MSDVRQKAKQYWEAFVAGDADAFRALHDLTYDELFRYAHRLTGQTATIRDALQEMYIAIWKRKDKQPPVREPWVFLLTALRHKIIDEARKNRTIEVKTEPQPSPETEYLAEEADRIRAEWLSEKLNTLPERQREAIHLRYRVVLGYTEIAEVMGVGQQVAYNYVNRGIKTLRKLAEA